MDGERDREWRKMHSTVKNKKIIAPHVNKAGFHLPGAKVIGMYHSIWLMEC